MSVSNTFISDLDVHRDDLYARALAAASASPQSAGLSPSALHVRAETVLQAAIRETFAQFEKDPHLNPFQEVQKHLPPIQPIEPVKPIEPTPMPADIWARLVAAIQVEAARSAHSKAINPDSVLLSPDPLLAPKKTSAPDDLEGLNLLPEYRFFLAGGIAILIALILTIYLLTRPVLSPPHTLTTQPTTTPTTHP